MITKLVMHYEYLFRNEARYEARNAPVCLQPAGTGAPDRRLWGLAAPRALRTRVFRGTSPTRVMIDSGERPGHVDERVVLVLSC